MGFIYFFKIAAIIVLSFWIAVQECRKHCNRLSIRLKSKLIKKGLTGKWEILGLKCVHLCAFSPREAEL